MLPVTGIKSEKSVSELNLGYNSLIYVQPLHSHENWKIHLPRWYLGTGTTGDGPHLPTTTDHSSYVVATVGHDLNLRKQFNFAGLYTYVLIQNE